MLCPDASTFRGRRHSHHWFRAGCVSGLARVGLDGQSIVDRVWWWWCALHAQYCAFPPGTRRSTCNSGGVIPRTVRRCPGVQWVHGGWLLAGDSRATTTTTGLGSNKGGAGQTGGLKTRREKQMETAEASNQPRGRTNWFRCRVDSWLAKNHGSKLQVGEGGADRQRDEVGWKQEGASKPRSSTNETPVRHRNKMQSGRWPGERDNGNCRLGTSLPSGEDGGWLDIWQRAIVHVAIPLLQRVARCAPRRPRSGARTKVATRLNRL